MSGIKSVFLVVVTFLLTPARGDVVVSCVLMESCILPCGFQASAEVVIHWIQLTAGDAEVHSYSQNQDQLSNQKYRFIGRTSLFKDQISKGNASLQLMRVQFQDQGRYKCYTSTISGNKESFINLKVEAPVRKVDIQQVGGKIICSSNGIYLKPELTWSTSPPSTMTTGTPVLQTEQQLYNIISSLTLSDSAGDLTYICTVSTQSSSRRASLKTLSPVTSLDAETTISCSDLKTPLTEIVWRFNHSQTILKWTGSEVSYTEEWRPQVKHLSDSGSLTLQDLSSKHEGMYTCELSNAEETCITNTFLRPGALKDRSTKKAGIAIAIPVVVEAIFLVVLIVLVRRCANNQREARDQQNPEPSNGVSHLPEEIPLNETENGGGQR